jgi:mono/diheme cytochrome c family protein
MKLFTAALTLVLCLPLAAQQPSPAEQPAAPAKRPNIPDHFTNLTVLPATITKPELMGIMKQFAVTMKVRCSNCHAVSDDLSEGSFASDEKPAKEEARKLIRLIHQATLTPAKP